MTTSPSISILIVNYNTRQLLKNCLQSVLENSSSLPLEIIVVDNGSTDGSVELVAEEFPNVRLIRNSVNLGFAAANNQGIKAAGGEYLLLLNSDTEVQPHALHAMAEAMTQHPEAGIVGCRLLNPDQSLQPSLRTFPNLLVHTIEIAELYRVLPVGGLMARLYPYKSDHRRSRWIDWVTGACLMVRRQALEQVGPMDEDYFMYGEEMDWCYRMRKRGWLTYYAAEAEVVHLGGGSSKKSQEKLIIEQYRSLYKFYRKHYPAWELVGLKLLAIGLTLPKVLILLIVERGKPHRKALREAYWQVALLGFRREDALRK